MANKIIYAFVGLVLVVVFLKIIIDLKRGSYRKRKRVYYKKPKNTNIYNNAKDREKISLKSIFNTKKLLYKDEEIALKCIEKTLKNQNQTYHVFPQVPLIVFIEDVYETGALAGLRPDFVITNSSYYPIAVVEINGSDHYKKWDKTKEIILNSAKINLLSIDSSKFDMNNYYYEMDNEISRKINAIIKKQ